MALQAVAPSAESLAKLEEDGFEVELVGEGEATFNVTESAIKVSSDVRVSRASAAPRTTLHSNAPSLY